MGSGFYYFPSGGKLVLVYNPWGSEVRAQGLKGMFGVFLFLDFPGERHFRRLRSGFAFSLVATTTSTVRDTIEISLVL